jgi:hypothetical protein
MRNIVYYMFSPGIYSDEIAFSIHTAYRFLPPSRDDYRFIIYCPPECEFKGIRAEVVHYEPQKVQEWVGPKNFRWRIKIKTIEEVLQKYGEPTVLIDGDTYFQKSPDELFERITPGNSVLHIREGRVCDLEDEEHRDLTRVLNEKTICDPITGARIAATQAMWNSGVVGLHPADMHLLSSSLELTDRIVAEEPINTSEQFATAYLLETQTHLRPCDDIVYHFWSMPYRRPFRPRMMEVLRSTEGMPEADRAEKLYAIRPQTALRRRMRNRLLRWSDRLGLRVLPHLPRQNG